MSNAVSKSREAKGRLGSRTTSATELFRLDGRTVLITGGGGSMGLEIAGAVAESGGDVICVDRFESQLSDLYAEVQAKVKANNTKLWYFVCDITNAEDAKCTFTKAMAETRHPLRGMVACAGISGGGDSIEFSLDEAQRIINVNVLGTFICCQAAGHIFREQSVPASVVLIASMSGHGSNMGVNTTIYNSSKSAVLQMARSLAAEWGSSIGMPSIRVNTISPGYIMTRMTAKDLEDPKVERRWCEGNMLNRLSEADEYRGPALFLLGDGSGFVTGADLRVDGGHTAW